MTTKVIKAKCVHAVAQDGCMDCLEAAMLYDEAKRNTVVPTATPVHEQSGAFAPDEQPAGPAKETVAEIYRILFEHAGEAGESEGAVDVVRRLSNFWKSWGAIAAKIRELNSLLGNAGPH